MSFQQIDLFPEVGGSRRSTRRARATTPRALREALTPYVDTSALARLAATGKTGVEDLRQALRTGEVPDEVEALLVVLSEVLRPDPRRQIRSPADAAALLMVQMAAYDQEHFLVISLDTKNRVQAVDTVYRGTLNSASIRIAEVFKPAIRHNAASILVAHNHPSLDPAPSPEDILVTRQLVEAGKLLDCDVVDHLVIGGGKYVSMREKGLGFAA